MPQHPVVSSSSVDPEWIAVLRSWAEGTPAIEAVYLFGSRVKGASRPESDLDVAVRLIGPQDDRLLAWLHHRVDWLEQLPASLPVKVDLQFGDPDLADGVVGPTVAEHGVPIYWRRPARPST